MFACSQYAFSVSFMNTESLSVSMPWSENGSCRRASVNTVLRSVCSRTNNGAHSVQPVAISVSTSVWMKLPRVEGRLWATRSTSTKPGAGSFQSADVRQGVPCGRTSMPGLQATDLLATLLACSGRRQNQLCRLSHECKVGDQTKDDADKEPREELSCGCSQTSFTTPSARIRASAI